MGSWYSADIVLGPYSWHVEPGDAPDVVSNVLAGLKVATGFADEDHPIQGAPGPMTASFAILVDDVFANVTSNVKIGSPVSILILGGPPGDTLPVPSNATRPPLVQFIGTVAELAAAPQVNGSTVVDVQAVDRLVDLANLSVGLVDYPEETTANRFERIWNEGPGESADAGGGGYLMPTGDTLFGIMAARPSAKASSLELIQQTLANQVDLGVQGGVAMFLVPQPAIDDSDPDAILFGTELDPERPFTLLYAYKNVIFGAAHQPSDLPFVFVDGPDGWTVEVDPYGGELVVDAGDVELEGTTYSKIKSTQVDKTVVTTPAGGSWSQYWTPAVPIEWSFEGEQTTLATARHVAIYALPPRGPNAWGVEKLSILDLPDTTALYWFAAYYWVFANPRQPIVVDGVVPEQNPSGKPWLVGMLANASIEFVVADVGEPEERAEWQIELELRADLPRAYSEYGPATFVYGSYEPYLSPRNMKWDRNELTANQSSFETSIADWTPGGSVPPTLALLGSGGHTGPNLMRITWGAGGVLPLAQTTVTTLGYGIYTASAWVYIPAGNPRLGLVVPGKPIGASSTLFDQWQRITLTFEATLASHLLQIWPATLPTAGKLGYVDDVKLESGPVATNVGPPALASIRPIDLDPALTVFDLRLTRRP